MQVRLAYWLRQGMPCGKNRKLKPPVTNVGGRQNSTTDFSPRKDGSSNPAMASKWRLQAVIGELARILLSQVDVDLLHRDKHGGSRDCLPIGSIHEARGQSNNRVTLKI